jgi:pSer/pThr/pTyr-binding forkhead associated (FHA) protein
MIQTETEVKRISLTEQSTWTFGRSSVNAIQLPDQCASRHHAKLECVQGRHFYFVDLNSRNGSLVNGQRIAQAVLLKHGDRITVGKTQMVFHQARVTVPGLAMTPPSQSVLMVQSSTTQGKIWQEILLSQGIAVSWEVPGVDLKQLLALRAVSNQLPGAVLVNLKAYPGHSTRLWTNICQQYPGVKIFILDSVHPELVSPDDRKTIPRGCEGVFPAFRKLHLVQDIKEIAGQVQVILRAVNGRSLHVERLHSALHKLEDLFRQLSTFVPLTPSQVSASAAGEEDFADLIDIDEDLTALNGG